MKKIVFMSVALIITAFMSANAFDWNIASAIFNRITQSQTNVTATQAPQNIDLASILSDIQSQTEAVDKNVQSTFLDLVSNLSSTQEAYSMGNLFEAILSNEEKTQSQKSSLISQMMGEYFSNLMNDKTAAANTLKNLPWSQKTGVIEDLASLIKNGQDYANLAKKSINAASTAASVASKASDVAQTIIAVNQTAAELKSKAQTIATVVSQMKQIASAAGVSAY